MGVFEGHEDSEWDEQASEERPGFELKATGLG
jgi:hypothetical protein